MTLRPVRPAHRAVAVLVGCALACAFLFVPAAAPAVPRAVTATRDPAPPNVPNQKRLPTRFEPNVGQFQRGVRFAARGRDAALVLRDRDAQLSIVGRDGAGATTNAIVTFRTVGSSQPARVDGVDRLPGITNYFPTADPATWRTRVPGFARVAYDGVYPGIDLVYYANDAGNLEYDFVVAPGADPGRIALSVDGADSLEIDASGDLVLQTSAGVVRQHAPRVYQQDGAARRDVVTQFTRAGDRTVGFAVASYDATLPLVIDPEVVYSTYLGSTGADFPTSIAADSSGAAYLTGQAGGSDYPLAHPYQTAQGSIFVSKLSVDGSSLVYSTFLGHFARAGAIAVDAAGAAYVVGLAGADFPLMNALQATMHGLNDAFVTKLSPDGSSLVYSTYLGGTSSISGGVGEQATDVKIAPNGAAFVVGLTDASNNDFPLVSPIQTTYGGGSEDWFVAVIDPTGGQLLASSYYGGNDQEEAPRVALVPGSNDFYLAGSSYSSDLVAAKPAGARGGFDLCEAYLLSMAYDFGQALLTFFLIEEYEFFFDPSPDCDTELEIALLAEAIYERYVLQSYPPASTRGSTGVDAIVTASDTSHHVLKQVAFGGSGAEYGRAMMTDRQGAVYIAGITSSTDLPTRDPVQADYAGSAFDGFVAVLAPGALDVAFATYIGGSAFDILADMALDPDGNIYVLLYTESGDLPATAGAVQPALRGSANAYIVKIASLGQFAPDFSLATDPAAITATKGQKGKVTVDVTRIAGFDGRVTVTAPDTKPIKVKLTPPSGSTTGGSVEFNYKVKKKAAAGTYPIVFTGRDASGRERTATLSLTVQ